MSLNVTDVMRKIEKTLDKLDVKVWGLAVLIVITPFLHKLI